MGDNSATASARTRFQLSESLKIDAKGAVKTAVEILGVAASMSQNVPYLGVISGALAEFLKIEGEVTTLRSDWKAVMSVALQIKAIVDRVRAQCEKLEAGEDALPEGFLEPLSALERCIAGALDALNACKTGSKRIRDRARVILNRADLSANVKQCHTDMQAALDLFNTKLHIINAFAIQAHGKKLDEILVRGSHVSRDPALDSVPISLPPPPAIFHGRAREVDHIVNLILDKPPARAAVLGSGGIGKTSIALTVLHRPEVQKCYGEARFFMSCEAVSTVEGVLQELLKSFRLVPDAQSRVAPRDILLSHLRALPPGILCLDNLETPWDADASGVESLLADIASLSHLALLVTTRGGDRPRGVAWTQPFLPEVTPLTLEAALDTWDSICNFHDAYSELLVKAVDLVPLAVTLLAQLALTETPEVLWDRWELEQTRLLQTARGPQHRLNSVERSIVLSLTSPILRDKEGVLQFFSVLCTLPQGLPESRIATFADAYASHLPDLRQSIAILKLCSLAYTSDDRFLRILSPIRHYIQSHHPCSDVSFTILISIYCTLVESYPEAEDSYMVFANASIKPELINISTILELSLSRNTPHIRRVLKTIELFSRICDSLYAHHATIVRTAIMCARERAPELEASLWASMGDTLRFQEQFDEALFALLKALELNRALGDRNAEADSLLSLGELQSLNSSKREAEDFLRSALELYTELDNSLGRAHALRELGDLYSVAHGSSARDSEVERVLQSALDLYEQLGNQRGKADVLHSLGSLHSMRNRLADAETALEAALNLHDKIGYLLGKANDMYKLIFVYIDLNRIDEAEHMSQSSLDLYRELHVNLGEANSLYGLGRVYQSQKLHEKAINALQEAARLDNKNGRRFSEALSLLVAGRSFLQLAQLDDAERSLGSALALFRDIGDRGKEAEALVELGYLHRLRHQYDEAAVMLQLAHNVAADADVADLLPQGKALEHLGRVHQECGELDSAQSCFEDALQLFDRAGCPGDDMHRIQVELDKFHLERQSDEEVGVSQPTTQARPTSILSETLKRTPLPKDRLVRGVERVRMVLAFRDSGRIRAAERGRSGESSPHGTSDDE